VTPDPSAAAQDGFALAATAPPADPPADPPGALGALDPHPATATATAAIAPHTISPLCLFICFPPRSAQRR
jgi:hypothetical protein